MTDSDVTIFVSGTPVNARVGVTIINALWASGMAELINTGCAGGVCGACTVTIRFKDGRPGGGTDLACLRPVEEGMEIFPCSVESIPPIEPTLDLSPESLRKAYSTLNRCTKCGNCTTACPMSIPVMDSVLRMQDGKLNEVSEDYTTCIHCGLCRFVCEDKVKPHNMGMWVRRSLGIGRDNPSLDQVTLRESGTAPDREWSYLLTGDFAERLRRAKYFREHGKVEL